MIKQLHKTIVCFGSGDISGASFISGEDGELIAIETFLQLPEPQPIGSSPKRRIPLEEAVQMSPVIFEFHNIDAITVCIKNLLRLRKLFKENLAEEAERKENEK